ncbi:MAG: hypothetical protein ACPGO3_15000, partial [Magnetospiraceae bacterium]
ATLPLWLLIAEGGLRLALKLAGKPYSGVETRAWLADVQQGIQPILGAKTIGIDIVDDGFQLLDRARIRAADGEPAYVLDFCHHGLFFPGCESRL